MVTVVIPAHQEEAVIGRCLQPLLECFASGEVEVIVVANGCTDGTAAAAQAVSDAVQVLVTPIASKTNALNVADTLGRGFPRVYADADVVLPAESLLKIVAHLKRPGMLVAAPMPRWDLEGASWAVRAYYAVDGRLPSHREGIGGSGVYALSEEGRKRFGEFPRITADDAFVRRHFKPAERVVVQGAYSIVTPPKRLWGVIVIKSRSHFGNYEIEHLFPHLTGNRGASNWPALLRMGMNPGWWPSLAVYGCVKAIARVRGWWRFQYGDRSKWERDETSRTVEPPPVATRSEEIKFHDAQRR